MEHQNRIEEFLNEGNEWENAMCFTEEQVTNAILAGLTGIFVKKNDHFTSMFSIKFTKKVLKRTMPADEITEFVSNAKKPKINPKKINANNKLKPKKKTK